MLIGNLSLIGTPFFSGFYSKDSIIEAAKYSTLPGSGFAYFAVLASVFVTAFYAFRQYFMVFHGEEKWRSLPEHHDDHHGEEHHGLGKNDNPHESPLVVTLPLILLAIPSVIIGYVAIEPMLYGDFFKDVIFVNADAHPTMHIMKEEFHGALAMVSHSLHSPVLYLAIAGVLSAWLLYVKLPHLPAKIAQAFRPIYVLFETNTTSTPCISTSLPKARVHWVLSSGKSAIPPLSTTASSTALPNWSARLPRRYAKSKPASSIPMPPLWYSVYWYCSA